PRDGGPGGICVPRPVARARAPGADTAHAQHRGFAFRRRAVRRDRRRARGHADGAAGPGRHHLGQGRRDPLPQARIPHAVRGFHPDRGRSARHPRGAGPQSRGRAGLPGGPEGRRRDGAHGSPAHHLPGRQGLLQTTQAAPRRGGRRIMNHPNTAIGSVRTLLRNTAAALALATAGLCAAPPALALTIANVDVPGQQSVAGRDLVLNGAGLRQRFVFHVYVAALYRGKPTQDAEAILNGTEPQLLRLTLLRDINSKALTDALNDGLKANCTEEELRSMADTIAHFEDFMKTG